MGINLLQGDITKIEVDAIVNAANTSLLGGGGVDGAIHKAGGPEILDDCRKIRLRHGECPVGEAVITTAGKLPASFVIHAVGPVWQGGNKDEELLLSNAYRNSLILAKNNNVNTIAFPNISTGIYRFPKLKAAKIAIATVTTFLRENPSLTISFVCYDAENFGIYEELLAGKEMEGIG